MTPTIVCLNSHLNALQTTGLSKVKYIKTYKKEKIFSLKKMISIPVLYDLKKSFKITILPTIDPITQSGIFSMIMEGEDYQRPVKVKQTIDGPIHISKVYQYSKVTKLKIKLPIVLRTMFSFDKNKKIYIMYISLSKSHDKKILMTGNVIGKIESTLLKFNQSYRYYPKPRVRLILDTGKMPSIKIGLPVVITSKKRSVAKGYIASIHNNTCVAELNKIQEEKRKLLNRDCTFTLYKK